MNGLAAAGCQLAISLRIINFADNNDQIVCEFDLTDFFLSELAAQPSNLAEKFFALGSDEARDLLTYTCFENDYVQNLLAESFLDTYALYRKNAGKPVNKAKLEAAEIGFLVAGCDLIVDGKTICTTAF